MIQSFVFLYVLYRIIGSGSLSNVIFTLLWFIVTMWSKEHEQWILMFIYYRHLPDSQTQDFLSSWLTPSRTSPSTWTLLVRAKRRSFSRWSSSCLAWWVWSGASWFSSSPRQSTSWGRDSSSPPSSPSRPGEFTGDSQSPLVCQFQFISNFQIQPLGVAGGQARGGDFWQQVQEEEIDHNGRWRKLQG